MNLYYKWLTNGKIDDWVKTNEEEIRRYSRLPEFVNQDIWATLRFIARCEWLKPKIIERDKEN